MHQENVHAGALADMTVRVQRNSLRVAIHDGFHANELRIHVVRASFRHGWQSVRSNAGPGTNANIYALGQSVGPKVGAPIPASHIRFDGTVKRVHANFAVAAQDEWLDVASAHLIYPHQLAGG